MYGHQPPHSARTEGVPPIPLPEPHGTMVSISVGHLVEASAAPRAILALKPGPAGGVEAGVRISQPLRCPGGRGSRGLTTQGLPHCGESGRRWTPLARSCKQPWILGHPLTPSISGRQPRFTNIRRPLIGTKPPKGSVFCSKPQARTLLCFASSREDCG